MSDEQETKPTTETKAEETTTADVKKEEEPAEEEEEPKKEEPKEEESTATFEPVVSLKKMMCVDILCIRCMISSITRTST